jgi:hypothetical protein
MIRIVCRFFAPVGCCVCVLLDGQWIMVRAMNMVNWAIISE